jgi:hypothetical protein
MPPEGETQLTADERALVVAWVQTGADEARELETAALPAGAVRALAAPAATPSERPAPNGGGAAPASSAPPEPRELTPPSSVAASAPLGRSGGCAACVVAEHADAPSVAPWLAGVAGVTLILRRKAAKRPDIEASRLRSG